MTDKTTTSVVSVSPEMAKFFMDQCAGTHAGHMANLPNNPVLHSLCMAHGAASHGGSPRPDKFGAFLRAVADALESGDRF